MKVVIVTEQNWNHCDIFKLNTVVSLLYYDTFAYGTFIKKRTYSSHRITSEVAYAQRQLRAQASSS